MLRTLLQHWQQCWFDSKGTAKFSSLLHSPLFWLVLVAKLVAACLFASDFPEKLFLPFISQFAAHPLQNPYAHFWAMGQGRAFPYPAAMLYLLAWPKMLLGGLAANPFLDLLTLRLPLLLADLLLLGVLVRWLRGKEKAIILLYWASPVLFYITYLHGQLDVLPLALLFAALYLLFRYRLLAAALVFGVGLAAKTHLLLALPFFFLYLWRREHGVVPAARFVGLSLAIFLLLNAPYLADAGFIHMVLRNAEQQKLLQAAFSFDGNTFFYLIPALYLFLLLRAVQMRLYNRDMFLMFLGFSFGALLFFIPPQPGWYFWIIPFFAYFFARAPHRHGVVFLAVQLCYFLYFGLREDADFFSLFQPISPAIAAWPNAFARLRQQGFDAALAANMAFTGMQTALLTNCAWIYRYGIKNLQTKKLTSRAFLIGISGDSGSGKTVLSDTLMALFTPRNLAVICGDDMHKWQRGDAKWQEFTHLDPKANELHEELKYLTMLRQNRVIRRRHYDHTTGHFTQALPIIPKPIMILEGLHSFYLKPTRSLLDMKIFVQPEENLLLHRKITRDMQKRGHGLQKIIETIATRLKDSEKFIKVQEENADIVVSFMLKEPLHEVGNPAVCPETWLRVKISNSYYLDPLLEDLSHAAPGILRYHYDLGDRVVVDFQGFPNPEILTDLGEKYADPLQDMGVYAPQWAAGWNGLLQLMIAACIFYDSSNANPA